MMYMLFVVVRVCEKQRREVVCGIIRGTAVHAGRFAATNIRNVTNICNILCMI